MTMRLTDRSIWTAPPPNPVRQCTVQVMGPQPSGLETYYYWLVAHYPIGSVISLPFEVSRAPKPPSASRSIILSWELQPVATSYDILRTSTDCIPADGSFCALALNVPGPIFLDQGQTLTAYNMSGLVFGSPVDGWAIMNNRDYKKPVLELWPTIRLSSILFADGSEQDSAGGGVISGVASVFGRTGHVVAQNGDYNASQIALVPPVGSWTTAQQALQDIYNQIQSGALGLWQQATSPTGAIYYSGGFVGINTNNPQFRLDVTGDINVNGGGFYVDGILFAGSGSGGSSGSLAHVGPTPPASPQVGQFWFNVNTLRLNIWALGTWIQI